MENPRAICPAKPWMSWAQCMWNNIRSTLSSWNEEEMQTNQAASRSAQRKYRPSAVRPSWLCRVHTLMLPVVADIGELYRTADGGAMATLVAKLAIEKSYQSKLDETRNAIQVGFRETQRRRCTSALLAVVACVKLQPSAHLHLHP